MRVIGVVGVVGLAQAVSGTHLGAPLACVKARGRANYMPSGLALFQGPASRSFVRHCAKSDTLSARTRRPLAFGQLTMKSIPNLSCDMVLFSVAHIHISLSIDHCIPSEPIIKLPDSGETHNSQNRV